jgi:hypothetical protein
VTDADDLDIASDATVLRETAGDKRDADPADTGETLEREES